MSGYLAKPFKAHALFAVVEGRGTQPADTSAAPSPAVDLAAFRRTMEEAGAGEAVGGVLESFGATLPPRLEALVAAGRGGAPTSPRPAAPTVQDGPPGSSAGRLPRPSRRDRRG